MSEPSTETTSTTPAPEAGTPTNESDQQASSTSGRPAPGVLVFRHRKRQGWGLAALLWEREGKRGYQFEDGQTRVFKEGYFDLLVPVTAPRDPAAARALSRLAARSRAGLSRPGELVPRVADQIGLFMSQYPEGFQGEAWQREIRGRGAKKALKRHRDRAVAMAARQLARDPLAEAIELERYDAVRDAAVEVLRVTDMVPKKEVDRLAAAPVSAAFAWAIYGLLHGDEPRVRRFDAFVRASTAAGLRPSWPLVTALMALWAPEEALWVRPSVLKEQARMVRPTMKPKSRPNGRDYETFLEVASVVRDELVAAGRSPADLLDVAQFVWVTLRPAARSRLIGAGDQVSTVH